MSDAPHDNVRQLLESRAAQSPGKQFLFAEDSGRAFTYREFDEAVNRAAGLLLSLGVTKGDRVSLLLTNGVPYLVFYFACFKIGAWAGPVNALLKPQEIHFIVENSAAVVAVTESDLLAKIEGAGAGLTSLRNVIVVGDWRSPGSDNSESAPDDSPDSGAAFPLTRYWLASEASAETLPEESLRPLPTVPISQDDEALIIYTSGTTGNPKGVLLTHGNLLANARQIAEWLQLTQEDRSLIIMPLFHVNALMTTCLAALWAGGSVVLPPRFSASRHWETVSRYGVTYFGSVATMLSMLSAAHPNGIPEGLSIGRMRFALCGSAPVPVEVMNRFELLFNVPVIEGYGLSESTCRATFNPTDERRRVGSVGLPIGNRMKVFDDEDRELAPGLMGEIVLRGPNVMKGYYRNDAANREAFRSGWFHTGDIGYRDQDGFFYVVDRKSDMIIRGGENIYPREIDEVLYRHPKVKDAATIGVADSLWGEEVKSFIVLRENEHASEEEMIGFCKDRLADFKCPKTVEFLDDIPKGPTGKLLKRELTGSSKRGSPPLSPDDARDPKAERHASEDQPDTRRDLDDAQGHGAGQVRPAALDPGD